VRSAVSGDSVVVAVVTVTGVTVVIVRVVTGDAMLVVRARKVVLLANSLPSCKFSTNSSGVLLHYHIC
jgi:hypothetical protein